jgi:hypothetical protein
MAALALAVAAALCAQVPAAAGDKTPAQKVQLRLSIAGLGGRGCDVEVKPGHASCKFRPVVKHVEQSGKAVLVLDKVETSSADRNCSFAITIREPGQGPYTYKRALRLSAVRRATPPLLDCFLSSPSKIAQADSTRKIR